MVVKNKVDLSKEMWKKFVAENSTTSYSLVVCLCILCIWEAGCTTEEEAHAELVRCHFGITGAQAEMAIDYALSYNFPDAELDETMMKIKRDKSLTVKDVISQE